MNHVLLLIKIGTVMRKFSVNIFIALAALVMVSCSDGGEVGRVGVSGDQASMAFDAPTRVLQARNLVPANLILEVTVEGRIFTVRPNADGNFVFRTKVTPNSTTTVSLAWFELIDGQMLRLATASKTLNVGSVSSPATLRFAENEFNTFIDDDLDGVPNLQERDAGTDPNDNTDPDTTPVSVTLDFRFFIPEPLENASDQIRSLISAQAFVNDLPVPLTREGDQWRGTATVIENTDPLVTAKFFATSEQSLQLAEFSRSENVGSGASIDFLGDVYEVDPFNADGDSFNNAEEIARGSDPFNKLDPDADSDGFADESDNCPSEPNKDQADADGDNVGDACDEFNNLVDPDEDGVSSSASPPDNCPSDSNPSQADVDGDGIGDACDTSNGLDPDNDQVNNPGDNCPTDANNNQADVDDDGIGDVCDPFNNIIDPDEDGVTDTETPPDNCPVDANPDQNDADGDGTGDVCELPNVAPTAVAGPDQTVEEGTAIGLNGSASSDSDGSLVSFQWFEGTAGLATGETATINNLSVGVHLIDLVVTDNEGATGTDQLQVTVTAAPVANVPPTAVAGPNQTVVEGTSVLVDGSASTDSDGTIVSFQWFEGTAGLVTGETATINNLSVGVHLIDLLVTDNEGATGTDQLQVTVTAAPVANVPPTAVAGPNQTVVEGTSVLVDGSASTDSDGTIVSFQWFEGTAGLATGETATINNLSVGVHLIDLLVTDNEGATGTDQLQVTVTAAPVANVPPTAVAGPNQTVVEGTSVLVDGSASTDSDGTIVSFQWFEGTAGLATGETATINNLSVGVHLIDLVVTDNEGATGTDQLQVTVTAAPVANVPPTAVAGPNQTVVEGTSVLVDGSASTDSDGTIVSYQWLEGGVELATVPMATLENLSVGVHLIDLVVTDDGEATGTDRMRVTVTAAPVANVPPTAVAGPNQTVVEGTSVLVDGSASTDSDGTIVSYQWLEGGVELASVPMATLENLSVGVHLIDLVVTDDGEATGTDRMRVTVTAAPVANAAPMAVAGPNQSVVVGTSVLVDGSLSTDSDGTIVSYQWFEGTAELATGETATINNLSVGVHLIDLVVTDDGEATGTDRMRVTVTTAAPVTNVESTSVAGSHQAAIEG